MEMACRFISFAAGTRLNEVVFMGARMVLQFRILHIHNVLLFIEEGINQKKIFFLLSVQCVYQQECSSRFQL